MDHYVQSYAEPVKVQELTTAACSDWNARRTLLASRCSRGGVGGGIVPSAAGAATHINLYQILSSNAIKGG